MVKDTKNDRVLGEEGKSRAEEGASDIGVEVARGCGGGWAEDPRGLGALETSVTGGGTPCTNRAASTFWALTVL